jgi:IPT/TIG domain/RTX calcium-binding nonapeptide repeat (4 copies)
MVKKVVLFAAVALTALGLYAPAAHAAPFTGPVTPTIQGGLADLNGTGTITVADSWVDFYGDTDVISGGLDCDAWGNVENDGSDGDHVIDGDDDCILIGVDGTADGMTIIVTNGSFSTADGVAIVNGFKLPTVFNASSPTNTSVAAADFAWQVINGRVDANGNNVIDDGDCSVGIVNGWDILGVDCGFAPPTAATDNGKIDVNGDHVITVADDSVSGFFGLGVSDGLVEAPTVAAPTITSVSPTSGAVGQTVTINGTNLTGATVKFGTTAATVVSNTGTVLKVTVPAGVALGATTISVTTTGGTATAAFTVTETPTGPCDFNGTAGDDLLVGTGAAESLCGDGGNDTIRAKGGPDLLKGQKGDDVLKGGAGNDTLKGGKGFDICKGGKGKDVLKGCEA